MTTALIVMCAIVAVLGAMVLCMGVAARHLPLAGLGAAGLVLGAVTALNVARHVGAL